MLVIAPLVGSPNTGRVVVLARCGLMVFQWLLRRDLQYELPVLRGASACHPIGTEVDSEAQQGTGDAASDSHAPE